MCHCNPTFDVRCTCWVKDSDFKKCPVRHSTTYWRIMNDYDFVKKLKIMDLIVLRKKY